MLVYWALACWLNLLLLRFEKQPPSPIGDFQLHFPCCWFTSLSSTLSQENAKYVHWEDIRQAAPAFITILLMPLTYSIAYGIICGLGLTIFLWVTCSVTCGRCHTFTDGVQEFWSRHTSGPCFRGACTRMVCNPHGVEQPAEN
jgi:hypothetical protein